jgi:ABC-type polysaccharide/polyol phosphate transport system ATPase subunit
VSSLSASEVVTGVPTSIKVEDVSITYRTAVERRQTLVGTMHRLRRGKQVMKEIKAVRGVSFDVPKGTVLGIVGANGAGKSTLVRAMAGILPPTSGRIEVHGKVSTLLALGVGFDRKMTGRQNVVLGGLAAGLSRAQVEEQYEEIVEFAELEEFMDMPMRTYSSGMYSRLAFSVAVTMAPDILLIDEALSTGDARFRRKSFDKMRELCNADRTIVLVSHAMRSMRELCDEAIWLHKGEQKMYGAPGDVIRAYAKFFAVDEADEVTQEDV